uniref:Cytochrome P450, family 27, subfamily A, polypeptide 7 n=1 Tax=Esox lucius TaxID=8010 RepID=A0A3P9A167_ESOLU
MALRLAQTAVQRSGRWLLPCPAAPAPAIVCTRGAGSTLPSSITQSSASQGKNRTSDDLPRIKTREMLYRMFVKGYYHRLHELQLYEKQLYGPMYVVDTGSFNSIALNSVELLEELLRKDEKFPSRGDMSLWTEYRDLRGISYGPFTEEGEKWYKLRTVLNKRMLHPKDSVKYGDVINEVVDDLIKRIYHLRRSSPTGDLVTNLSNELYRFSLEGISSILFETRIGCLEEEIPLETQDFIDSIAQMFSYSMHVVMLPKWSRNLLPFHGRYISGWEGIFKFARKMIDMKMEVIQRRVDTDQEVEGEYLTYLLSNTKMTSKDVYGSVAELLLAGVDTTSNTMMWTMYLLSRDPAVQETLYQEVSRCVPGDKIPSAQDVNQMPYLKAVIREALRMYPVVPVNARIMVENDVIIGGHFFPKKTTFTMCHYAVSQDEKTFPEPSKFKPERWMRDGRARPNPFGSIPFGFGVRGCVGRRIAELEMYLALSRIIKLFEIRPDPSIGEVKALNRTVLVADRKVNLHFLERAEERAAFHAYQRMYICLSICAS